MFDGILKMMGVTGRHRHGSNHRHAAGVYAASPLEDEWTATDRTDHICATAALPSQVNGWRKILSGGDDETLLSRMPDGRTIEPLTGVGRHPFSRTGCRIPTKSTSIFDISYIRVPSVCHVAADERPRVMLFDMGCADYESKVVRKATGGGRASRCSRICTNRRATPSDGCGGGR